MHVVVTNVRAAAGLPGREVACAECLCGWVCVVGVADAHELEEAIADHLTSHGVR